MIQHILDERIEHHIYQLQQEAEMVKLAEIREEKRKKLKNSLNGLPETEEVFENYMNTLISIDSKIHKKLYIQGIRDGVRLLKLL